MEPALEVISYKLCIKCKKNKSLLIHFSQIQVYGKFAIYLIFNNIPHRIWICSSYEQKLKEKKIPALTDSSLRFM